MSILRRGITILTLAPAALYVIQSFWGVLIVAWFLQFVAMLEWTGLKRHLKLCLLDPLIHSQRKRLQNLQRLRLSIGTSRNDDDDDNDENKNNGDTKQRKKRSLSKDKTNNKKSAEQPEASVSSTTATATTTLLAMSPKKQNKILEDSSPSLGLFGEPDEDELVVLEDLRPWPDCEFPTPIAPLNLFIVLKCFACSLVAPLAAFGTEYFLLMLTLYFFFWVLLTLLDRNRAETKQDVARRKIQGLTRRAPSPPTTQNNNNSIHKNTSNKEFSKATRKSEERFIQDVVAKSSLPDANEFALRELEIVSCYPNVETFINFTLEYFGFVWISNLAFSVMLMNLGPQGKAALSIALFANWMNDAGALIVGKTLKAFGTGTTHPLYPRISPSKSLEGAVFGILFNAGAAALGPFVFPAVADNIPNQAAAPKYFFFVGIVLGILGVIGDLLQSLFKRVARIKDTGTLFPGHGGVLDRIDGLVTTMPVVYWLVWALQQGYFLPLLEQ